MIKFTILTIFPKAFSYLEESILAKAQSKNIINIEIVDIRNFTNDKHNKVDDIPYWWGQWMVLKCQPFFDAIDCIKKKSKYKKQYVINLSPRGKKFTQKKAEKLSNLKDTEIILLCWRYEWIDQRVIDVFVDDEISIWNFIVTWWELPAMLFIDAVSRLIPWVIWKEESYKEESFSQALWWKKEFPYYTRPEDFRWYKVPKVLISWNHKEIQKWKKENLK